MKPALRDIRTGSHYPADLGEQWGKNGIGDGYGPVPRGYELVENTRGKKGPDGTPAMEVSGGALLPELIADATADEVSTAFKATGGPRRPDGSPGRVDLRNRRTS